MLDTECDYQDIYQPEKDQLQESRRQVTSGSEEQQGQEDCVG